MKEEKQEKTHWLQSPNKNYLGHWDLPESGEMVVTIESAQWEPVTNPITNKTESCRVIRFKEDIKPMICNQTNAQSILLSSGVKFMEDSKGVSICLFVSKVMDRRLREEVDCIRVKRETLYTKEMLEKLFQKKKGKLKEEHADRFAEIILNEEKDSYGKAFKHLESL